MGLSVFVTAMLAFVGYESSGHETSEVVWGRRLLFACVKIKFSCVRIFRNAQNHSLHRFLLAVAQSLNLPPVQRCTQRLLVSTAVE